MGKLRTLIIDPPCAVGTIRESSLEERIEFEFVAADDIAARLSTGESVDAVICTLRESREECERLLRTLRMLSPRSGRLVLSASESSPDRALLDGALVDQVVFLPFHPDALVQAVQTARRLRDLETSAEAARHDARALTEQVRIQSADLSELAKLRHQFIMIANHELRTPATIITAALDILDDFKDDLEPLHRKLISSGLSGAERLNRLIDRFDTYLRLQSADTRATEAQTDLAEVLQEVRRHTVEEMGDRDVYLHFALDAEVQLGCDPAELKTLFTELLSNAVKYTPDGGQVVVTARVDGCDVELSITDTGIGIEPSQTENVFQPFHQLGDPYHHHSSSYSFRGGGVGLGLAICKRIVERRGGRIEMISGGPGAGSRVQMHLPLRRNAMMASA